MRVTDHKSLSHVRIWHSIHTLPVSPETTLRSSLAIFSIISHKQQRKEVRNKWFHQQSNQKHKSTPSESDVDDSLRSETQKISNNAVTEEQANKQDSSNFDVESDDDDDKSTRISSRQKRPPAAFKARPENPIAERSANLFKPLNTIPTKNIQMTAIQSLTSTSPTTFQDMALSIERSLNIIRQVTNTLSLMKTAIQK